MSALAIVAAATWTAICNLWWAPIIGLAVVSRRRYVRWVLG